MIYGPRKTADLLARASSLRAEGFTWRYIAKQLKVSYGWLEHQRTKLPDMPTPPVAPDDMLDRVQAMRDRRMRWKAIANELGYDKWQTLYDALQRRKRKINPYVHREDMEVSL
jgi:orotate phosphoribosyltransferase-like protein